MLEQHYIDDEELIGRTVANIKTVPHHLYILFTDGTFTSIGTEPDFYTGDTSAQFEEPVYSADVVADLQALGVGKPASS